MIANIDEIVDPSKAIIHPVSSSLAASKKIQLDVLRLDKIHAIVSGNKWFKLKYSLQEAIYQKKDLIVTSGGAYSNHIHATAYSAHKLGLKSLGLIRGEEPRNFSPTLLDARSWDMEFEFLSRGEFRDKDPIYDKVKKNYSNAYLIEEGGQNEHGIQGASEILTAVNNKYSHICCSIGSGTMMTGLLTKCTQDQEVIGISSLRISVKDNELNQFIDEYSGNKKYWISYDYSFGGYARETEELIEFMNKWWKETGIPSDFVYTGKLFFAIMDLIEKEYFPVGSTILIIHSGGLQGNRSLPVGKLLF